MLSWFRWINYASHAQPSRWSLWKQTGWQRNHNQKMTVKESMTCTRPTRHPLSTQKTSQFLTTTNTEKMPWWWLAHYMSRTCIILIFPMLLHQCGVLLCKHFVADNKLLGKGTRENVAAVLSKKKRLKELSWTWQQTTNHCSNACDKTSAKNLRPFKTTFARDQPKLRKLHWKRVPISSIHSDQRKGTYVRLQVTNHRRSVFDATFPVLCSD